MRTLTLLLALAALTLAGCTSAPPASTTTTSTPSTTSTPTNATTTTTSSTPVTTSTPAALDLKLEAQGVPASASAGQPFTFTLHANGTTARTSDHVGAHYGANSSNATPSTTIYPQACAHQAGDVPGAFAVNCTIATPGVYFLRGHVRLNESGTPTDLWTDEHRVLVVGNLTLATDLPASGTLAHLDQPFKFTLYANGTGNLSSDHVGAHYNGTSQSGGPASVAVYGNACEHQAGFVPGVFTITCTFTDATTPIVYLRGHVRITDAAGVKYDFWTSEVSITVAPI